MFYLENNLDNEKKKLNRNYNLFALATRLVTYTPNSSYRIITNGNFAAYPWQQSAAWRNEMGHLAACHEVCLASIHDLALKKHSTI